MSTRSEILDAFELLLLEEGVKGASFNAVAARVGISKGGLLYHFESKDELIRGVLDRSEQYVRQDLVEMSVGAREAIDYFVRTSIADVPERQTSRALQVLATTGNTDVMRHLSATSRHWRDAFEAHGLPGHIVTHVMLVAEGLYSESSQAIPALSSSEPDIRSAAQGALDRLAEDMDYMVNSLLELAGLD